MKHRKATINILAGAASLIAIALSVNAWTLWNERKLVLEETNKLQTELTQQIRFANEHSDYKTYQITLLEKQKKLKQQAEQNLSLNNRLQRLQKQTQAQSIQLSSMQLEGKPMPLQHALQLQTVKISAVGNFYSLLRWLRQAERDGCKVKELRLHSDMQAKEVLKMDISLEFHTGN